MGLKLNRLSMHGFKSFQNKTAIPLFDGFNAVIGPNGSGKSNVTDALCFALGRRSRDIRAGRMDHLIFNGGQGRSPADAAIVKISFDNSERIIPIDEDSVEITRRVNRRGLSTYKLNGKGVTKTEIDDLFKGIKVDPDGHNIIQQGDVTSIIEMKPRDRRAIVDEIAGIKEYNEKKARSQRELDIAEAKIKESMIIFEQKKELLEKLGKEKESAEKYQKLQEELDFTRACISFTRVNAVRSTLENVERNLQIKELEYKASGGSVDGEDSELEKIEERIRSISDSIIEKSVNSKLREEIEEINQKIIKRQGDIQANSREVERLEDMIDKLSAIQQRQGGNVGNQAVQSILNSPYDGVCGSIGQSYTVESRFTTALDVAVGGRCNDIIVENEDTAITCVNHLKSNNMGRLRFLPLDRIRPRAPSAKAEIASNMPGIIDFAINLIEFDHKYETAYSMVLGDTLVAESVDAARKVRGVRIVTLDGEVFEASGAIVGGSLRKKKQPQAKVADLTDIREYERAVDKLNKENKELDKEINDLMDLLDEKKNSSKTESKDVSKLEEEKERLEAELTDKRRERKSAAEKHVLMQSEIDNLRLRKARLEAESENMEIEFEKYKDRKDLEKGEIGKLESQVKNIGRRLRALGYVNMKSLEEYNAFKDDFEAFEAKLKKLEEEKEAILQMIEQIEEKRKGIFKEALDNLAGAFAQVFADLMEGEAALELEDTNDIDSGLLIKAQPKDKKLLSIDSMSGGEKTMTALAFLFAVQRYKPAPFYILDEVDAALDNKNSEKVGNLIQKYAGESQFIVISHNDVTVRRAHRVYGVSMRRGSSQVLGVSLDALREDNAKDEQKNN